MDAAVEQLGHQALMWNFIEGFAEIQHDGVGDASLLHGVEEVRGGDQELRLT